MRRSEKERLKKRQERVNKFRLHWHGDCKLLLQSGQVLPLSRRYREVLTGKLGIQGPLA